MIDILSASIIRIYESKKEKPTIVGSGFLVTPRYGITCAHVVTRALGIESNAHKIPPQSEIELDFPLLRPKKIYKAKVFIHHPIEDLAILKFDDELPEMLKIVPLAQVSDFAGHKIRVLGFPKLDKGKLAEDEGAWGVWSEGFLLERNELGWIQINSVESTGYLIQPGFSGAPVWDDEIKSVVGIIAGANINPNIRTAHMIPLKSVFKIWPEFRNEIFNNIQKQWSNWLSEESERTRRNLITFGFDKRLLELWQSSSDDKKIISPLMGKWQEFITSEPWHKQVEKTLFSVQEALQAIKGERLNIDISKLLEITLSIDMNMNYSGVIEKLRGITKYGEEFYSEITRIRNINEERKNPLLQFTLNKMHRVNNLVKQIQSLVSSPSFARCFLVMGEMGSGKTHFVVNSVFGNETEFSNPYLIVPFPQAGKQEKIEDVLIKEFQMASNIAWPNIDAFAQFIDYCKPNSKIVVVLDDLSKWALRNTEFVNELIEFIESHTRLRNIYWVITIPESFYPTLARLMGKNIAIWTRYGFANQTDVTESTKETLAGGWFVLDDLNERNETGVKIIKKFLPIVRGSSQPLALEYLRKNHFKQYLYNPFIAWMWLDLAQQQDNIETKIIPYIEFIENFRQRHHHQMQLLSSEAPRILSERIGLFLKLTSQYLMSTGELYFPKAHLLSNIAKLANNDAILSDPLKSEAVLEIAQRGLLIQSIGEHSIKASNDVFSEMIEIKYAFFWEYLLARQLISESSNEKENLLKPIRDFREKFNFLPEFLKAVITALMTKGVIKKYIGFVHSRLQEFGKTQSLQIRNETLAYYLLLDEEDETLPYPTEQLLAYMPQSSMWLAGVYSTSTTQQDILSYAFKHQIIGSRNLDGQTLFAFLHFMSEVKAINNETIILGLKLLQPAYTHIARENYTGYFLYVFERLLSKLDSANAIIQAMRSLSGCEALNTIKNNIDGSEMADVTHLLAIISVQALNQTVNGDEVQLIKASQQYLLSVIQEWPNHYEVPGQREGWFIYLYREWVMYLVCSYLVTRREQSAYQVFKELYWYENRQLQQNKFIVRQLEREANRALGHLYRHREKCSHNEYLNFVNGLVNSKSFTDRNNAFHIIRLTSTKKGGRKVHRDFVPFLEIIAKDKEMAPILCIEEFDYFMKENVPNWQSPGRPQMKRRGKR